MEETIRRIDLQGVNCYLLGEPGAYILVDTGGPLIMDKGSCHRGMFLMDALDQHGCMPGDLKLLLLTHGDIDHAYNAKMIGEKFGVKIAIHPGDLEAVSTPSIHKVMENANYSSALYRLIFKVIQGPMQKKMENALKSFNAFMPDVLLDESFKLSDYGIKAKILPLPGHTPGSIGILFDNGDLICGDTLSNLSKPTIAPNAVDFDLMHRSIHSLDTHTISNVYPGHGNPFPYCDFTNRS